MIRIRYYLKVLGNRNSEKPMWIIFLLLCNKSPQIQHLKTIHICYLSISVGSESRHGHLGHLLRVSQGCSQGVNWLCSSLGLSSRRVPSLNSSDCRQYSVPCGCRTKVLSFLLIVSWGLREAAQSSLLYVPLTHPLTIWQITSLRPTGESLYSWLR